MIFILVLYCSLIWLQQTLALFPGIKTKWQQNIITKLTPEICLVSESVNPKYLQIPSDLLMLRCVIAVMRYDYDMTNNSGGSVFTAWQTHTIRPQGCTAWAWEDNAIMGGPQENRNMTETK